MPQVKVKEVPLLVTEGIGSISLLEVSPSDARAVVVLAHGAGAGMKHRFMEALAMGLAELSIATVRFNFPYVENGRKRPDAPGIAEKAVEKVMEYAHTRFPKLPLFLAGKSFGGRMSSQLLSKYSPPWVRGIIFYGFPLHPTGAPGTDRAKHLSLVKVPMLFLSGTKDTLADMSLLEGVIKTLPKAQLIKFEGADHSFNRAKTDNIPVLAEATDSWVQENSR